jgi:hypothetical protein
MNVHPDEHLESAVLASTQPLHIHSSDVPILKPKPTSLLAAILRELKVARIKISFNGFLLRETVYLRIH